MAKKVYIVEMNHKNGTCKDMICARTVVGAVSKAVVKYHHLGVRFNTIANVSLAKC